MAYASQKFIFREFDELDAVAGQTWPDADGVEWRVYVRTQCLIVDYIDFAMASGVSQNQACPVCECPRGCFHITNVIWANRFGEVDRRRRFLMEVPLQGSKPATCAPHPLPSPSDQPPAPHTH